jgi:hypothetical protein
MFNRFTITVPVPRAQKASRLARIKHRSKSLSFRSSHDGCHLLMFRGGTSNTEMGKPKRRRSSPANIGDCPASCQQSLPHIQSPIPSPNNDPTSSGHGRCHTTLNGKLSKIDAHSRNLRRMHPVRVLLTCQTPCRLLSNSPRSIVPLRDQGL